MKRIIAIGMLVILSVTSIRPTVALHYCGGVFHSFGLTGEGMEAGCCGEMGEEGLPGGGAGAGVTISATAESCCDTRVASIATDDFQTREPLPVAAPLAALFACLLPVSTGLPRPGLLHAPRVFPPGGKILSCREILSLLSVARN
jgi:hypothetical protein